MRPPRLGIHRARNTEGPSSTPDLRMQTRYCCDEVNGFDFVTA